MSIVVEVYMPISQTVGQTIASHEVGRLIVSRLRKLDHSKPLDDQVHPYAATMYEGESSTTSTLNHRYGDGAWVLISNALAALNHPENKEVR